MIRLSSMWALAFDGPDAADEVSAKLRAANIKAALTRTQNMSSDAPRTSTRDRRLTD
jgi:hypothetical protein